MLYKNKNRAVTIALVFITMVLFSSCKNEHQKEQQQMQNMAVDVDFIDIKPVNAALEVKYPGSVEGTVNVDIKSQVTGYIEAIHIKEGSYVSKGTPLFSIRGEVLEEQINLSKAALKAALAAQENAKIELEKIKPLVREKVVSDVQLKTAEVNYKAAIAQVEQAKAALRSAKINASYSIIKAPIEGYIGRIPNRIGNLVSPNDATPLTTLSEINNIYVYFSLSEADFLSYAKDIKSGRNVKGVEIILADGQKYQYKGKLESASGNLNSSTGSMAMKAVFPNPDKILRSGGFAEVILKKSFDSVYTVPISCVKDIQNKYFVFIKNNDNTVKMTEIVIAGISGKNYIIKSGIKTGDKVALNQLNVLNDGMLVSNTNAK